jgi:hypothetical protein
MAITIPISLDKKKRLVLSKVAAERISKGKLKIGSSVRVKRYPDGSEFPERIALEGKWKLNEKHDLEFRVSASSVWFPGMTIAFKTGVISAKSNKIVFSARLTDPSEGIMTLVLAFSGRWQVDKNNRLTFSVARYSGKTDRLVFQAAWQVNKNNELFYKYSTRQLKTKEKKDFSFRLKGSWSLGPKRITYNLKGSSNSVLSFSAALGTPSIRAKDGEIRYTVGVRITSGGVQKEIIRSIAIYGTWKLGRDLKLGFEVAQSVRKKNIIKFTAAKPVFEGSMMSVALKTEDGKNFGSKIKFTQKFSEDMDLFLEGSRDSVEKKVLIGIRG